MTVNKCHSQPFEAVEVADLLTLDTPCPPAVYGALLDTRPGTHPPLPPLFPWVSQSQWSGFTSYQLLKRRWAALLAALTSPAPSMRVQPSCGFAYCGRTGRREDTYWTACTYAVTPLLYLTSLIGGMLDISGRLLEE